MAGLNRTDFSRGEQIAGLTWLSLAAIFSLICEVVYVGARLPLGGGNSVAFPVTIVIAWTFNVVLAKTARLWSTHPVVGFIPVAVWTSGFILLLLVGELGSIQILGNNIWTVALLFAGVTGGVWPNFAQK